MTIDGKIARDANHPSNWTSPEDKTMLRKLIAASDAIIIGHTTYLLYKSQLASRRCVVFTRSIKDYERHNENLILYNPEGPTSLNDILKTDNSIALLGGAQTYSYFLENNLIDEIYLTIEPIIFGEGLNLFETSESITSKFHLISTERLNQQGTMLLHYKNNL